MHILIFQEHLLYNEHLKFFNLKKTFSVFHTKQSRGAIDIFIFTIVTICKFPTSEEE